MRQPCSEALESPEKGDTPKKYKGRIGIIGGGWYGCHTAIKLRYEGYEVTLFEKNHALFKGISGKFGAKLHSGAHYPRSKLTRELCHKGIQDFLKHYPDFAQELKFASYLLGDKDAHGKPPKVSSDAFRQVCKQYEGFQELDLELPQYQNVHLAFNIQEHSLLMGDQLSIAFNSYLKKAGVSVVYNCRINTIVSNPSSSRKSRVTLIPAQGVQTITFDHVVNATSFQALLPKKFKLPFNIKVGYQPAVALIYEDTYSGVDLQTTNQECKSSPYDELTSSPDERSFSVTVMDGWFPCFMPYRRLQEGNKEYILTHGSWTILGTHETVEAAREHLSKADVNFINTRVKPNCEEAIKHFWPGFTTKRFQYKGWAGDVIAKVKSEGEFRSAFVFRFKQDPGISYIFPGKVSNIFSVADELSALIGESSETLESDGVEYLKHGTLHKATEELQKDVTTRNTLDLQTFSSIYQKDSLLGSFKRYAYKNNNLTCIVLALIGCFARRQINTYDHPVSWVSEVTLFVLGFSLSYMVLEKSSLIENISSSLWGNQPSSSFIYGDFLENPTSLTSTSANGT